MGPTPQTTRQRGTDQHVASRLWRDCPTRHACQLCQLARCLSVLQDPIHSLDRATQAGDLSLRP